MDTNIVLAIYFFVVGICSGSFFNVVGLRIPIGQKTSDPKRSYCVTCQRNLTWYELVPVFSYLALGGKCRTCKTKISPIYPSMELITGLLYLSAFLFFGMSVKALYAAIIFSMLVIITVSDLKYRIIPNKVLLFFAVILLPVSFFVESLSLTEQLLGLLVSFIINFLIVVLSKGKGMGGGDIKLFLLLGYVLGLKYFIATFFISVTIGLVVALVHKFKTGENAIPFGPSIAMAVVIVLYYGDKIINWYLGMY